MPGRQLGRHLLHLGHRLAGADPRRRLSLDLHGRDAVVAFQPGRGILPAGGGEGGEGHHLAAAVADVPVADILRHHPVSGVGLDIDLLDPAVLDEVVDVGAAPGGGQHAVGVVHRNPHGAGPHVVDVELELRGIVLAVGPHRHQFGVLHGHAQKLVAGRHQLVVAQTVAVLQFHVEAVGEPEFDHRRRGEGEGHAVPELGKGPHGPAAMAGAFRSGALSELSSPSVSRRRSPCSGRGRRS